MMKLVLENIVVRKKNKDRTTSRARNQDLKKNFQQESLCFILEFGG